jgi:hypothetical protein
MPGSKSETQGRFCDDLGNNTVVQNSVGPAITFHARITVREYVDMFGNQVHPLTQTLFPSNDAVFKEDSAPIHTPGTVQSRLEKYEDELKHIPWPAQSLDLNIIKQLWSVLETRVRNRFLPPTSLKQIQDILQEEWYKIPLDTLQNL